MKTDFAILWVDDNEEFVDSLRPQLEQWMANQGFTLVVHSHRSSAGVLNDLAAKEIELVILDYRLRGNRTGDKIIEDLRGNDHLQDIIFYSQGGIPNDVFDVAPDGVFFVDRLDASARIKQLIHLKIRRLSDLATLRGWIVADAIELEIGIGKLLGKCFKGMEPLFTKRVLLEEGIFDFGKKHRVLSGIIKDKIEEFSRDAAKNETVAALRACKKVFDVFPTEIIEVRNALAHQMAEISDGGRKVVKTKTKNATPIEITHDQCVKIRNNVRKHQANIVELANWL